MYIWRFLLAFFTIACIAILGAHLCFPVQSYGHFVRVDEEVAYSPVSFRQFRKLSRMQNYDSTFRVVVMSSSNVPSSFSTGLVTALRRDVSDPRLSAKWHWSTNWQYFPISADGTCLLFRRPGRILPPDNSLTAHNYFEGWASCSVSQPDSGMVMRLICRSKNPDCLAMVSSGSVLSEKSIQADNWKLYEWSMSQQITLLTLSGEHSPEIGALVVEPVSGVSIWQISMPPCSSQSLIEQAKLLHAGLVIMLTDEQQFSSSIRIVNQLFEQSPKLICLPTTGVESGSRLKLMRCSIEKFPAALLLVHNSYQNLKSVSRITQAIGPFIH